MTMNPGKAELQTADVVISLAGRDRGQLYYVKSTDGGYVNLVNGKNRPLEQPKRKSSKHVEMVLRSETRVAGKLKTGDKVLNGELRRDLASISQEVQGNNRGG